MYSEMYDIERRGKWHAGNRNRSYTHWMFDTTKFQIGFRQIIKS